jgi:hypothetical protein
MLSLGFAKGRDGRSGNRCGGAEIEFTALWSIPPQTAELGAAERRESDDDCCARAALNGRTEMVETPVIT